MNYQEIAVNIPKREGDKLFNFRPVFFTAIFLCFGIVFSYADLYYHFSIWWMLLLIPIFVAPLFFCKEKKKVLITFSAVVVLAISFMLGCFSFGATLDKYADCKRYHGAYSVVGTVVEKAEYDYSVKLVLQDVFIGKNAEKGKLVAYMPLSFGENIAVSDEILLHGNVRTETGYFNDYGFRAEDIGNNVQFLVEDVESCAVVGKSSNIFLRIRAAVEERLFIGMDNVSASVTLAVLTGDTALIEKGLLENVRMGGIAHIFAVSGLHVGALYGFCLWLTEKTRLKALAKPVRFLMVAVLLVLYAGVCGFSSSVVRAMTLCLVSYAAKLIGTESDMLQSTGLAAIFVLLIKPTELFSVGFQLSFAACLGIALFARPLRLVMEKGAEFIKKKTVRLFRLNERARSNPTRKGDAAPLGVGGRMLRAMVSFASVSLAAQIATSPLLLYNFEYLSLWGLLLNGIFVPFISAIFSALLLFVLLGSILPLAWSSVILSLPSMVWNVALLIFEGMDFSTFALYGIRLSFGSMICYYGGWVFLTDKWNMPKRVKRSLSICCFLAFVATMYALNF